jgi:hemolysin III
MTTGTSTRHDSEDDLEQAALSDTGIENPGDEFPLQRDQEWANALSHGLATAAACIAAVVMVLHTRDKPIGTMLSCVAFVFSVIAVFAASTLSHVFIDDAKLLRRMRAWDQGLIYLMITGTYTPLVYHFADAAVRGPLLVAIWIAAFVGFYSKVLAGHRINGIGTATYLALGWLPAMFLIGRVPTMVLFWMAAGGVIYTLGVVVLVNDFRIRYLHVVWHLLVVTAASCHYWAIYQYVAGSTS